MVPDESFHDLGETEAHAKLTIGLVARNGLEKMIRIWYDIQDFERKEVHAWFLRLQSSDLPNKTALTRNHVLYLCP